MTGKVYLVGAGPGAADLLTVRAARLLAEADIVFHDALVHEDVLSLIRKEKITVGKRCGRHSTAQRFINKRLLDAARAHRVVVRLKGGDPMLFGRAHEEIDFLRKNGIEVEVVPGVTAALAASAELGVSLTRRGLSRSVTFLTTRTGEGEPPNRWLQAALGAETVAFYMGLGEAQGIASGLMAAGKPGSTPVVIVEGASLEGGRTIAGTLAELPSMATAREEAGGPVLILLGEVYAELALSARGLRLDSASQAA